MDRLDGAHAPELTKKVQRHASSGSFPPSGNEHPKEDLSLRLKKLTHAARCMLFMKGTPQEPRCGKGLLGGYSPGGAQLRRCALCRLRHISDTCVQTPLEERDML